MMDKTFVLIFGGDLRITLPPSDILVKNSQTLQMLSSYNEFIIDLTSYNYSSFLILLDAIHYNKRLGLNGIRDVLYICSYLMVCESFLRPFLPFLGFDQTFNTKVIFTLLTKGFPNLAKEMAIEARIPPCFVDDPTISYNKFTKQFRDKQRLHEWYVKYCAPFCTCLRCHNYHVSVMIQQMNANDMSDKPLDMYPTPYYGAFKRKTHFQ